MNICPNCKNHLRYNSNFCTSCGFKINKILR
ncbi:MAG: zinc ribbon domain-containing protein [Candidatus Hodarchaeota archaeon]